MAVLKIVKFGGLVPSAAPDALPDDAFQKAENLESTTWEFRPVKTDVTVVANSGVSNPATLFRLQRNADGSLNTDFGTAGKWIVSAKKRSYVKAPNDDDLTDRHIFTTDDGSAPPQVIDATGGAARRLGVPKPTTAPTVTLLPADEFTVDERNDGIASVRAQVLTLIRANLTPVWRGAPEPGSSTTGVINWQSSPAAAATQPLQARVYRTSSVNGAFTGSITHTYATFGPDSFQWVWDPIMKTTWATGNASSPSWQGGSPGNYYDHMCITYHAYGMAYTVNSVALASALAAIPMPGTSDGTKFFTSEEVDEIIDRLEAFCDPSSPEAAAKIEALANKVAQLRQVLDQGTQGALVTQRQAWWAKTEITNEISTAVDNAAEAIWLEAQRAALYTDVSGGEGGA